jgi:hypothetical protein
MWYSWANFAAFTVWHDAVCVGLGIPHPGRNASTGEVDESAQWTTAYTTVVEVAGDDWRAWVKGDVAVTYTDGLGAPSDPPPPDPELEPFEG